MVGWLLRAVGRRSVVILVLGLTLLAGAGGPGPFPRPGRTVQAAQAHVTSSGFVCPEPRPLVELSSRQLDLLIWPQYVPPDLIECFRMVYGVAVDVREDDTLESMED